MGILKNNTQLRNSLKGRLSTLLSNIDDIEETKAELFVKWCESKSKFYKDGILKSRYKALPNSMQRGDIVMCELGINIPPEFGNDGTGKHFVVVWGQQGHNLIVIPITKETPPKTNIYTIALGSITGMPSPNNYAKLDAIRTVSLRRISKVFGPKDGKIVEPKVRTIINTAMKNLFIDDN